MMLSLAAFPQGAMAAPEKTPNIIFILADDLGYGDIGRFGQKIIKTPNLDQMAADGMTLTSFYAGSTVCAPSRSVLMTGYSCSAIRKQASELSLVEYLEKPFDPDELVAALEDD